jgi:hypothetical protein
LPTPGCAADIRSTIAALFSRGGDPGYRDDGANDEDRDHRDDPPVSAEWRISAALCRPVHGRTFSFASGSAPAKGRRDQVIPAM